MTTVMLEDAVVAILDAMVAIVKDAKKSGGDLAEVKSLVWGNSTRPFPDTPVVWIVPEAAEVEDTTPGLAESWTMAVHIIVGTRSDDIEKAKKDAIRLAAIARRLILAARRLGLGLPYVNDVVSTRFDAIRSSLLDNKTMHWADATVTVRFRIRETS
jgi:hypothetical protein